MQYKKTFGLFLFSLLVLAIAVVTALAPMPAQAAQFAAGDYDDGICSCPVTFGDCVCKIVR